MRLRNRSLYVVFVATLFVSLTAGAAPTWPAFVWPETLGRALQSCPGVAPAVTTQPADQTICNGATASFSAAATGTPSPAVQWEVSTDSGASFSPVVGATSLTYGFPATNADNLHQFRAVFTNSCGTATTTAATLTVVPAPPSVVSSPATQNVCAGSVATYTASSNDPTASVQWQVRLFGAPSYTNIPGGSSTTYSFTAASGDNGNVYRAVFNNACGSVTTSGAPVNVRVAPVVTTAPVNQTFCAGSTATFTAAASGSPAATVRWQVSADGGVNFSNIAGATSTTYSFTANNGDNHKQFRAVFTNLCSTATTAAATLTIGTLTVTTNPTPQTACAGTTATFSAASSNGSATVQWQVSADGGTSFANVPGATLTSYSFTTAPGDDGHLYRAVFNDSCGVPATTTAASLATAAAAVTSNPTDQTACEGTTAVFSASATGNATAQWQVSTDSGATYNNIPGATTPSYAFVVASGDNGHRYRAVFTNSCGTATTTAATLAVGTAPVVTSSPQVQTVCEGTPATYTASASGSPSVQWQVKAIGAPAYTNIPGATSTTYTFTPVAADNGSVYRAVFTTSCGTATSGAAVLNMRAPAAVTAPPVNQTACPGATATFTAAASGNPAPTVRWQVSTDGGATFNNIAGATATTYSFTTAAVDDGKQYRAAFTNLCNTVFSTAATLTVTAPPAITTSPASQTICAGTPATFTAAATGSTSVQWQVSTDGGASYSNIAGATSTTYSFTSAASDNGNKYRAMFTGSCASTPTNAATLTIYPALAVTAQPAPQMTCNGTTATFTAAASGGPAATVQWQVSTDSGASWNNIPSATSTTYAFAVTPADSGKQFRARFTNSCSSVNSNAASLTVTTKPVVTTSPVTQNTCEGQTATYTAAATGDPNLVTSVQWYVKVFGGSTYDPIPGATSPTYAFTASTSQDKNVYRATFTNSCGTATTSAATLNVRTAPVVSAQPVDTSACAGSSASFTATATGTASTVQWQVSTNGGTTWANIVGATSTTYTFTTAPGDNAKKYRAVFTNPCTVVATNAANLQVNTPPVVTTNPVSQTFCDGDTATFTAAATGTPTPGAIWMISTNGGTSYTPLGGGTTLSLVVHYSMNGALVKATFGNSCSTADTSAATITVRQPSDVTFTAPSSTTAGQSYPASVPVTVGATYAWTVANGTITGGQSTNSITFTAGAANGDGTPSSIQLSVAVTSAAGCTTNGSTTITDYPAPQSTTITAASDVCASSTGNAASVTAQPGMTYQWSITNGTIASATTGTSITYTAGASGSVTLSVVATNGGGSTATSSTNVSIDVAPVITGNPTNQAACAGSPATFTASASATPAATVQWQVSTDGGATFTNVAGATLTTYSFTTASSDNNHQYRARFTNACGANVATTAATLTINAAPVVTTNPSNATTQAGNGASFTAAATGTPTPTVQWQVSTDGGTTFNDIGGATSTTLNLTNQPFSANGNQFRARFTNTCGTNVATTAATLTVTCPAFTWTASPLPVAVYHTIYSTNISATNVGNGTVALTLANSTAVPLSFSFTDNGNGTATVASANPTVTGSFTFDVRATTTAGCVETRTFTLNVLPKVVNDTYSAAAGKTDSVGNTQSMTSAYTPAPTTPKVTYSGTLLANDEPVGGMTVTATTASNANGSITYLATGDWIFTPTVGFTGTTSYTYTVNSNGVSNTGTVTIVVSQKVWYVNNSGANGNGSSGSPFNALSSAQTAAGTGDIIFVHVGDTVSTPLAGGITLNDGQKLWGEAFGLSVNGNTIVTASATQPRINNPGGPAVTITAAVAANRQNIEIRGLDLQNRTGSANLIDVTSSGTNANLGVTIAGNTIRGATAKGISIAHGSFTGTATISVQANTFIASTGNGIDARATSGTMILDVSSNAVVSSANAINIDGTGSTLTTITNFANNTISGNTGGNGIVVTNAKFDAIPGGIFDQVIGGNTSIGTSGAGNGVGAAGMVLTSVSGNLGFNNLQIYTDNGAGLRASGTTPYVVDTAGFQIALGAGTVVAVNGPAIDVNTVKGNGLSLDVATSSNSPTTGIALNSFLGTFSAGSSSSISGSAGTAFQVGSSNANISYAGSIGAAAGRGVDLTNNTGSTISFTGALTLSTGANTAFNATGGGTVTTTTSGNTLATTTGTALNVANTTIGSGNLYFTSISAGTSVSGPTSGIVLNNTGSVGGLIVVGNGTAGTGGTIQKGATGISLTSTRNPSIAWMQLNDFTDFAIRGASVVGFTMDHTVVNGTNGDDPSTDEGSVRFTELTGSASITNSNISGSVESNFRVVNTTGTLNRITFTNTTFGPMSTSTGDDGLVIESQNTAVINATISNCFFTAARGDLFNFLDNGTGADDLVFTNNALTNNHPAIGTGGGGVTISDNGNGDLTLNIANNTFRDAVGIGVLIVKSTGPATVSGTFDSNTIGAFATANSGSKEGDDLKVQNAGAGVVSLAITNNTFRWYNNFGIDLLTGGGATAQGGSLIATITGNTIANPGNNPAVDIPKNGLMLNAGTVVGDTYSVCLAISGNQLAGSGADAPVTPSGSINDFRLRQRQNTTVKLPGYGGPPTATASVVSFVQGNNHISSTPSGLASAASNGFIGGASCP